MTLEDLIKRGTELRNYAQERADNHDEEKWRDYYAGQVGGLSVMLTALKEAIAANNNGWISVDEPPVVSVGGVKEFNIVTRDQLGHQTVESAWYLNQYQLYSEDSDVLDGYDDEGYRPETGWYKCLGTLDEEIYFRLHTVTHWQPLPPPPEQTK